jgi:GAF domain-containing protein
MQRYETMTLTEINENTRLFAAESAARQRAETLRAAGLALSQTLDLNIILETMLDYLFSLIPYDSAAVMIAEGDNLLVTQATRGFESLLDGPEQLIGTSFRIEKADSPIRLIHNSRQSLLISDINSHSGGDHECDVDNIVRSWIGVPLVAGGRFLGLFSLGKAAPGFFHEEHVRLAEDIAVHAAVSIQNALLYEAEQKQTVHLQQSQALLIEIEKVAALGRLTASIAHEINNPIQAIQGCLTLVIEELESEGDQENIKLFLDIIQTEVRRVADIVRHLRDSHQS